jgi:ADP-L-glycero-D-manno-heptose 6-epimerase
LLEALAARHPAEILLAVDHSLPADRQLNLVVAPGVRFMDHQEFLRALESGELAPAVIFHMGACSSTTETNWDYLQDNNLVYSQRLWTWCAGHGGQLIYASSAATYGDGSQGFDDELSISRLQPLNLYGKSKQDFDLWVEQQMAAGRPQPRQSTGLKFFNVYGPGETHKGRMASIIFHGWTQIHQQGLVRLFKSRKEGYADGGQLRDFIYVRDVVDVMLALAERPDVSGLFNLGTGRAHSFRELIEELFVALGRKPRIEYIQMPDDLQGKYQYFTEATMRKLARARVPYAPTPLGAAVADYAMWLKDQAPGLVCDDRPIAPHDQRTS